MILSTLAHIFAALLELIRISQNADHDKDLEILVLRYQFGIAQRKLNRIIKPTKSEKLTLDIVIHKRTIQKYIKQVRKKPGGQNWATFLKNHSHHIWACDFTVVHTLFFKPIYIFVVIEHETRKIVHAAVTKSPTDAWTAQQIREATPWGNRPKYLIHDNDGKYGRQFKNIVRESGIKAINTPPQAPKANAICERFLGSVKWECLDHVLVLNQYQLKRILKEYQDYYNQQRPHQGIEQRIPGKVDENQPAPNYHLKGEVVSTPVLNGLFHNYSYAQH